ncbi:MAG: protease inhibitor I42 family protein [Deltaproteobacteria bacterium]|nr:protease inhibitor I42 family protein [Deltaproteobacteria bacterium]
MSSLARCLALLVVLLALGAAAGLADGPPVGMGPEIRAAVGQEFEIRLPSNPSTGYGWILSSLPPFLEGLGPGEFLPGRPGLAGAGGEQVFRLRAVAAGEGEAVLSYRRPWEEPSRAAREFRQRVVASE